MFVTPPHYMYIVKRIIKNTKLVKIAQRQVQWGAVFSIHLFLPSKIFSKNPIFAKIWDFLINGPKVV